MIHAYENYLTKVKQASGNTVSSYMRDIRQYADWLQNKEGIELLSVSQQNIRDYLQHLQSEGKSGATASRTLASLKNFYHYLVATGFLEVSPVDADIHVDRGERKMPEILTGKEQADSGRLDIGETVRFGYYSQEGMAFDDKMKVIDAVTNIAETIDTGNGRHMTASQFLQYFLFAPSRQHDYIYKLSGGERRRLYLCTVLMRNPNFLILDEPTNDLDIMTLRVLENYLQSFKGCLIVVSHDRYFMDKIVDHLFVFQGNGVIKDFPGNYTDYRLKCQEDEKDRKKEEKAQAKNKNTKIKTETKRKLTFAERREYESLEKEISDLETEKASLENDLCSGTLPVEELTAKSKRLVTVGGEIEAKTLRWLELAEIDEA